LNSTATLLCEPGDLVGADSIASGKADVLALPASLHLGQWPGLVMLGVIAWLLYRTAVS
jgi:hypothetical protein